MTDGEKITAAVPTYYGSNPNRGRLPEYGQPVVPVLVQEVSGIRLVLGTHDANADDVSDVQVERRPRGWVVFLQHRGGDQCGYVYFLDDGRVVLRHERLASPRIIEVRPGSLEEAEVDAYLDDLSEQDLAAAIAANRPDAGGA